MKFVILVFLVLVNCDLQNRYPDKGEFCIPMQEISECIEVDFREKKLVLNKKDILLNQITRVQYEFNLDANSFMLEVLSEHRVQIRKEQDKKIYIRKKGPKVSLWSRIKKLNSGVSK